MTKCDYMSLLRYVFGERAHVLTEVITKSSRVLDIVATVVIVILFVAMA